MASPQDGCQSAAEEQEISSGVGPSWAHHTIYFYAGELCHVLLKLRHSSNNTLHFTLHKMHDA